MHRAGSRLSLGAAATSNSSEIVRVPPPIPTLLSSYPRILASMLAPPVRIRPDADWRIACFVDSIERVGARCGKQDPSSFRERNR